jgi:hypothetical protein
MIKLPSNTAAILAGAIVMPLFIIGWKYADEEHFSGIVIFLWSIVAFFLPVVLSTADLGYLRRTGGYFRTRFSRDDFKLFYLPAWKRLAIWFLSTVFSVLLLKLMGLNL